MGGESEVLQGCVDVLLEQIFVGQRVGVEQSQLDEEQLGLVGTGLVDGGGQRVVDGFETADGKCG